MIAKQTKYFSNILNIFKVFIEIILIFYLTFGLAYFTFANYQKRIILFNKAKNEGRRNQSQSGR